VARAERTFFGLRELQHKLAETLPELGEAAVDGVIGTGKMNEAHLRGHLVALHAMQGEKERQIASEGAGVVGELGRHVGVSQLFNQPAWIKGGEVGIGPPLDDALTRGEATLVVAGRALKQVDRDPFTAQRVTVWAFAEHQPALGRKSSEQGGDSPTDQAKVDWQQLNMDAWRRGAKQGCAESLTQVRLSPGESFEGGDEDGAGHLSMLCS